MSDSQAYTYYVNPTGSGVGENNLVNVTSPSWVLTFIRWKYRDTYRIDNVDQIYKNANQNPKALDTLKATLQPLVVVNDCISVTVTSNKNSFTPSMEATLLQTDVNYMTAIAPGDFVTVNMVNWESQADTIYNRASQVTPGAINNFNDGFKGIFKVQSVRRSVSVIDQETGKKSVVFKITAYAFTEFNNMLYFDPSVSLQNPGISVFSAQISQKWQQLVSANKDQSLQDLIKTLISSFIGISSPKNAGQTITGAQFQTPNDRYFMPGVVGQLLGIQEVTCAADVYNYWFGIQQYTNTSSNATPKTGLNPQKSEGLSSDGFFYTNTACAGRAILSPEYWNQVKAWDILNQYTNKPLNEFFTCFRADPDDGTIIPTVVLRQIPFTNEDFFVNNGDAIKGTPVTMFMNLPRWKISPALVLTQEIGRDEALRINFVQTFARILQGGALGSDYTLESANHNYQYDLNDIQRSGLRPAVTASMFDIYGSLAARTSFNSPIWSKIHADALIGGHLKLSGSFLCAGIPDPIAVGDNLEFEDVVYHIEQVVHMCSINPGNGIKTFRTAISVSNGLSVYSSAQNGTSYPEMTHTNAYGEREWDYKRAQILPGVSESQDVLYRRPNVDDIKSPLDQPNNALPQPKQTGVFPDPVNPKNNNNGNDV
jgi:hypothetical protein